MKIPLFGGIKLYIRTRNEHCPPHVHAECPPEGWSARFRFGYLTNDVEFWDIRHDQRKRPPSAATLDAVGEAIDDNLFLIRERWWRVMGTVCLDNQPVMVMPSHRLAPVVSGDRRTRAWPRVREARYDPLTRSLTVTLSDGSIHNHLLE